MNAMPVAKADDLLGKPRTPREDGFVTLDACHRKTLNAVEALEDLTGAIARGEDTPSLRASATAVADFLSTTARLHHEDEERHVFPALRGSADAAIVQAVMSLTQDHGWLEEDWLQLEPHLRAYACGYGLCEVEALTLGVPVFAALYREHIALEESLIYPEAREQMAGAARREMGREMAARRRVRRPDARP
jgi:hemerythrin-like domain-containing protein